MKLSELISSDKQESLVYGINVDGECLSPPAGIETIGLLYEGGPAGLSENLMDAIISFSLAGVHVILEVQHHDQIDADLLVKLAGNAGFSISVVPPEKEADVSAWGSQCAQFVQPFLTTPNFGQHVYPVAGYFSYLIAEKLGGLYAAQPNDPYVISRFTEVVPEEWSNQAKAIMRQAFRDSCGGEEGLHELAVTFASNIRMEASKIIRGHGQATPNQ